MNPNRSLAEALSTAKRLRREADTPLAPPVSNSSPPASEREPSAWVRHTVGLRAETSLKLRDAADAQKRKQRYGRLNPGEPANEQEIAELGISLSLRRLNLE